MLVLTADRKMQMTRDEELPVLVLAALRDPAAYGRLYDRFVQPVYRYVYGRVGDAHAAEDITSQTFIAAYESLGRYRERGYFSAWLFRIARSKLNDHFRRTRREVGLDAAGQVAVWDETLGSVIRDEELQRLRSVIGTLDEADQDLIRLRFVADLSFGEMAELLGRREDAVKKSVHRLLARLKSEME